MLRRLVRLLSEHRWVAAVLLGAVGFLLNTLSVPVLPGVHLIFGGVAYLLAAAALGAGPGLVAAFLASLYTISLWGHPYAVAIFSIEGLVVGYLVMRRGWRLLTADVVFWIVLGTPLVYLFYFGILRFSGLSGTIILLKQGFNGLLYALMVEALLLLPAVRRVLRTPGAPRLRSALAVMIALLATLPALVFGVWEGEQQWRSRIERAGERVSLLSLTYASKLEQYVTLHQGVIRSVAEAAERRGEFDPEQLQRLLSVEHEQFPGFLNLYAADARGVTVAFHPVADEAGNTRLGLDFSDRDYYRRVRESRSTVISDVFAGRGGANEPLVVIAHPILLADTFAGYIVGALDLRALPRPTVPPTNGEALRVADAQGMLVFDSGREYQPGDPPRAVSNDVAFDAVRGVVDAGTTDYLRGDPRTLASATTQRVLVGVAEIRSLRWRVWMEHPFSEIQASVAGSYVGLLSFLVVVILAALVLSHFLAYWLADPLLRVRGMTAALASGDLTARVGRLPQTVPVEITELGRSFDEMAAALAEQTQELLELGEAAQAASRAKSDFIAAMSHELRTPLNAVLGHLELLEMGLHGELNEAQRTALGRIETAARHLRGLIEEVLSFARLEAGRMEVHITETDLCGLAEEVAVVIEPLAREKKLVFRMELCAPPEIVPTDPDKVRQILINLAGNAVKFTERGEVRISVEGRNGEVVLTVADTGPGIPEADQARLFRPFEQLQSGLSRPHEGTGLGLYLSSQYAVLLGGRIELESEPGRGSAFSLVLPRQGPEEGSGMREEEVLAERGA